MRTPHTLGLAAAAALLAVGCSSNHAVGRVTPAVIDLYDVAATGGSMELEIARDGRIMEAEADIPISALPAIVLERARSTYPNAEITGAEKELQRQGAVWEVKLRDGGRDMELVMDSEGVVHETEVALRRDEAPPAVLANAEARIPGGTFRSVERIQAIVAAGPVTSYHVKIERDGATYKIVLDEGGRIHRTVREHRAEIEIPLE